jgi:hypothetical protein
LAIPVKLPRNSRRKSNPFCPPVKRNNGPEQIEVTACARQFSANGFVRKSESLGFSSADVAILAQIERICAFGFPAAGVGTPMIGHQRIRRP